MHGNKAQQTKQHQALSYASNIIHRRTECVESNDLTRSSSQAWGKKATRQGNQTLAAVFEQHEAHWNRTKSESVEEEQAGLDFAKTWLDLCMVLSTRKWPHFSPIVVAVLFHVYINEHQLLSHLPCAIQLSYKLLKIARLLASMLAFNALIKSLSMDSNTE